ncbi:Fucose permease [Chryseobacterium piscicola]|uniref:Fucose permease n=1 Tax=Chryseobacterium piscicola TaxID=551459 RepID=A0A1N7LIM4_9FLAO|nr:MFS transporter [Chryseobacterium piscicola]PQA97652.1 MFS transporter [Chryseobacterium piscicola]SIS73649.1 Fucose permease [Chryseobacterium piscicola]
MTTHLRKITFPLKLTFLIFSMVLNCMGIIILQLSDENVSYNKLGFLESFKDLPIAFISLFAVNFISRIGTKKSIIIALFIVAVCSIILPFVEVFWFYKLWFAIIGTCFALGKICVFNIIKNNISEEKTLAKTMNSVEASFMIGIFVINTSFGWLISSQYGEYWKFGFFGIALISFYTLFLFYKAEIIETEDKSKKLLPNLDGYGKPHFLLFFGLVFFIVFTEQTFNSWLPSFYKKQLGVNSFFALQASSFLAVFCYLGRIITAQVIKKFDLSRYFYFCIAMILIILAIIISIQILYHEKSIALLFIFPIIGLFLSPLYPVANSKMISSSEKEKINVLTSIIVIFSSLGSSASSALISIIFQKEMLHLYSTYIFVAVIVVFIFGFSFFRMINQKL